MGPDNRLNADDDAPSGKRCLSLGDAMAKAGIPPRVQDLMNAYSKRGNMMIVAARLGMSQKHCQNLYQEAVREMKAKVEEKEAAKADRLKSNNTTSTRN